MVIIIKKIIDILKYIFIGFVQGVSEILPISSSGHLALTYKYLNIDVSSQLDLTIYLHLASCLALCIFFKDKLKTLICGFFNYIFHKKSKEEFNLCLYIILATIPICIVGFFIKPFIEKYFDNMFIISFFFLITALLLLCSSKLKSYSASAYSLKNTLFVGMFQSLAIFPGLSRSGTTMFAAKLFKLDDIKQKEFSFLLLIPVSLGSLVLSLFDLSKNSFIINNNLYLYLISMIIAFIITFLSLKIFFYKISKIPYRFFSIYLILLALLNIFLLYIQ